MKCVDCGGKVKSEREEVDLKVTLNNPGVVILRGEAMRCENCGEKYTDEDNFEKLADEFDKKYSEKHKRN